MLTFPKNGFNEKSRLHILQAILLITVWILPGCKLSPTEHSSESRSLLLTNGHLIDGTGSTLQDDMIIWIEDETIVYVEKNSGQTFVDTDIFDLQGAYILPGFINTHVHQAYDGNKLKAWARDGVTTVRDLGNSGSPSILFEMRDLWNRKNEYALLIAAGPMMTARGGYGYLYVDTAEEAAQKTHLLIQQGADLIKIALEDNLQGRTWPMLSREAAETIVKTAHSMSKPVSCHVTQTHQLAVAIEIDVDDIAHMIYNDLPDSLIDKMIDKKMYWIPTLELWNGVCQIHHLNWYPQVRANLKKFYDAGGKIALGTDYSGYIFDFDLGMPMTELRLMRGAGMSTMDIIIASTKNAAHVCGMEDVLGTIEAGKRADIIVTEMNPLEDINALDNLKMVIHSGQVIYTK